MAFKKEYFRSLLAHFYINTVHVLCPILISKIINYIKDKDDENFWYIFFVLILLLRWPFISINDFAPGARTVFGKGESKPR